MQVKQKKVSEEMKIFGFHILSQKTLDERLTLARAQARWVPNKMISKLLWQIHSPNRKSLMQAYQEAQMRLREKVNAK